MRDDSEGLRRLLSSKDLFILDGDGTLYIWDKPLPFASVLLKRILKAGKRFVITSNNDSKSKSSRKKQLEMMLRVKISDENLLLPNDLLIEFFKRKNVRSFDGLVTDGLEKELIREGFVHDTSDPDIVVIGFDLDLTYEKLKRTIEHIKQHKKIVLTHMDDFCPYKNGLEIPDAGILMRIVSEATKKLPDYTLGKPSVNAVDHAMKMGNSDKEHSIIIGDRPGMDIKMANDSGVDSILLLANKNMARASDRVYKPNLRIRSLASVYGALDEL